MATIKIVSRYYIRSDGTYFPAPENTGKFYPNSNYSNLLEIMLEDGTIQNTFAQVNFLLNGKFVTEWLPLFKGATEVKTIEGVNVSFTKHSILVPRPVLQNASPTQTKDIGISVRVVYGEGWKGVFDTVADLETDLPPTEALADEYATAYVTHDNLGFFQVQYNLEDEIYEWVAVEIANLYQEVKSYGIGTATLQQGFVNPKGTITIEEATTHLIFLELGTFSQDLANLTVEVEDLNLKKLEKIFTEYAQKETFNENDLIAINDSEVVQGSNTPKYMTFADLMKALNVSFDPSGVATVNATNVQEALVEHFNDTNNPHSVIAIQVDFDNAGTNLEEATVQEVIVEVQDNVETVQENLTLHEEDENNPHNTTATKTPFTPTVKLASETVQEAIEEVQDNVDNVGGDLSDLDGRVTQNESDIIGLETNKVAKSLNYTQIVTLANGDKFYVNQGGNARFATLQQIKNFITVDFAGFGFVIADRDEVTGLPNVEVSEIETNKIYLVAIDNGVEDDNIFEEYIYVETGGVGVWVWELIGTTRVNLEVATQTEDGLMSKEDKKEFDELLEAINFLYEEFVEGEEL